MARGDKYSLRGRNSSKSGEDSFTPNLDTLAARSSLIIFETKSTIPLSFTTTKLTICPNRVTITQRGMFSREEYPIPIESIIGARIYAGIIFASLYLETFGYTKPKPVRHLRVNNARLARRYILALIDCKKNNVEISTHKLSDLREKLKKIGRVREGFEDKNPHLL